MTNWPLDVPSPPSLLTLPPDAASLDEAHAAIELWEHYSRKRLDPEQRLTVCVMMARTDAGRWAAATTGREMARQNGKGDEVEVVELWGLVQLAERILHTVHDAVLLATETQQRMLGVLESSPDLSRLIARKWLGTGQQMIELTNGATIWYRTRSGGGGRGVDEIDRLVIDEAQHVTAEQVRATTPTQLASNDPQTNYLGSGGIEARSKEWWRIRKRALLGDAGRFGYVGHTAETIHLDDDGHVVAIVPDDLADEDLWRACNPALRRKGDAGVDFLREQWHKLGPEGFAQEHLCVWAPEPDADGGTGPIPPSVWADLLDAKSTPDPAKCSIALDTNPERTWFTLSLAGERADGLIHGEIMGSHPSKAEAVDMTADFADQLGVEVTVSDKSGLAGALEAAGATVYEMSSSEQAAATSKLIDATRGATPMIRHQGQPAMRKALELAQTKPFGDGGIVWSRRTTSGDISPLTALTMAFGRLGAGVETVPTPFSVI